jgi:predicted nucleic acid-binding protein
VIFVDTNVLVYAASGDAGALALLQGASALRRDVATSSTVIEELHHLELRARVPAGLARDAFTLLRPLLEVTDEAVAAALSLDAAGLGAADRLHVGVCRTHGIETIATADRAFDGITGLRRIDPLAAG